MKDVERQIRRLLLRFEELRKQSTRGRPVDMGELKTLARKLQALAAQAGISTSVPLPAHTAPLIEQAPDTATPSRCVSGLALETRGPVPTSKREESQSIREDTKREVSRDRYDASPKRELVTDESPRLFSLSARLQELTTDQRVLPSDVTQKSLPPGKPAALPLVERLRIAWICLAQKAVRKDRPFAPTHPAVGGKPL